MTSAFCEECGAAAGPADYFCQQCGNSLVAAVDATDTQSPAIAASVPPVAAPGLERGRVREASPAIAPPARPTPAPGLEPGRVRESQPVDTSVALRGVDEGYSGRRSSRSKAWIYYLILAIASLIAVFAGKPIGLLGAGLCGAYSYYIYNGGRVVIWFW